MCERESGPSRGVHAPENTDPDLGKHTWDHLVASLPLNLVRRAAQRVTAQAHGPYVRDAFFMSGQTCYLFYLEPLESSGASFLFAHKRRF